MRKAVHEVTVEVLRETNNPAVMWGDAGLLDTIYRRARCKGRFQSGNGRWPTYRWKCVLDALSRNHGILIPQEYRLPNGRLVRAFALPTP